MAAKTFYIYLLARPLFSKNVNQIRSNIISTMVRQFHEYRMQKLIAPAADHSTNHKTSIDDQTICEKPAIATQIDGNGQPAKKDQIESKWRFSSLDIVDSNDGYELISKLRKRVRKECLPTDEEIQAQKRKLRKEFLYVMQPKAIQTGYRITPERLIQVLRHLYYWLPKEEWRKLWGDGRCIGGKKSCAISIANVNNEQALYDIKYHSTKEIFQ